MLHVRLLGQYAVLADDHWIDLPNRPAQLLFAFLVLHAGIAQQREHLAGLFWPDSTAENARSNLRHTLWQLRKALGPAAERIRSDDFSLCFDPDEACQIDVLELDRAAASLKTDEQLMASAAVYDGELMPGFYEPWVVLERERLQAVFESKMGLLLERLVVTKRWTAVIGCAERWIALGGSPEPAYRSLMTAHAYLGHMSQVHGAYQRCRESLADNLGLVPSPETNSLYAHLTSQGRSSAEDHGDEASSLFSGADVAGWSPAGSTDLQKQLLAAQVSIERERYIAEVHRRAAMRSTRIAAGLALLLAAAVGALARGRPSR